MCNYRPQRSWGKVILLQASVILSTGGGVPDQVHPPGTRYTPSPGTRCPPGTRYTPPGPGTPPRSGTPPGTRYTPWDQVHPPGLGTPLRPGTPPRPGPPRTRYTPSDQVHPPPPQTRYTPQTRSPQDQVHPLRPGTPPSPLDQVHPPRTRSTPWIRYTPWTMYTPGTRYTPPRPGKSPPAQSMLGDTVNERAVRILLECNLVSILKILLFGKDLRFESIFSLNCLTTCSEDKFDHRESEWNERFCSL